MKNRGLWLETGGLYIQRVDIVDLFLFIVFTVLESVSHALKCGPPV